MGFLYLYKAPNRHTGFQRHNKSQQPEAHSVWPQTEPEPHIGKDLSNPRNFSCYPAPPALMILSPEPVQKLVLNFDCKLQEVHVDVAITTEELLT